MQGPRFRFWWVAAVALVGASACQRDDPEHEAELAPDSVQEIAEASVVPLFGEEAVPVTVDVANGAPWAEIGAEVTAHIATIDAKLRQVPTLKRQELANLRADVSAVQMPFAMQYGIQPGAMLTRLIAEQRVIQLPEATRLWVLRDMKYSVPYLVPSAAAMLIEIGNRFQARLDSLGIPRFRLEVTSALRTADSQAALRKRNRNAAPTESTHEFGTTVDIAYRKFAPPLDDGRGPNARPLDAQARVTSDSLWILTARQRGSELQAVLGRVLQQMRLEGKLVTRMERGQPVYHTTVAREYPRVRTYRVVRR